MKTEIAPLWILLLVLFSLATPSAAQEGEAEGFVYVPLTQIANWALDWIAHPPAGEVVLGGIPFDIPSGSPAIFAMQGYGSEGRPAEGTISSLNIPHPQTVYLLPSGGWLMATLAGQKIGEVIFDFNDGTTYSFDLLAGVHLRETWDSTSEGILTTVPNPQGWQNVWATPSRFSRNRNGYLDLLTIKLPDEFRQKILTSITFRDTSRELSINPDPAIHVAGVTVRTGQPGITLNNLMAIHVDLDGRNFELVFNTKTCGVMNGADFIIYEILRFHNELSRIQDSLQHARHLVSYLAENDGGVEQLRKYVEQRLIDATPSCKNHLHYLVGSRQIDLSGLGNISFGFFATLVTLRPTYARYVDVLIEQAFADFAQRSNQDTRTQIVTDCNGDTFCVLTRFLLLGDFPDDSIQIEVGSTLAERFLLNGTPITRDTLIALGNEFGLSLE